MEEKNFKAGFHGHILNGFIPFWFNKQGVKKEELLQRVTDICLDRGIGLYTVISESYGDENGIIPKYGSGHRTEFDDRLGFLTVQARKLPPGYYADSLDNKGELVALIVERGTGTNSEKVIFLNGQTVVASNQLGIYTPETISKSRIDHIVIGTNQIRNLRYIEDVVKDARDRGLIQGGEHIESSHFGMKEETAKKIVDYFDYVEENMFDVFWSRNMAKRFARRRNKPIIRVDDSHRPKSVGVAGIKLPHAPRLDSREVLISDLRKMIKASEYRDNFGKSEPLSWKLRWIAQFQLAEMFHPDRF